jgi:hypothetical protein
MKLLLLLLLLFDTSGKLVAQSDAEAEAALRKEFPVTFQLEKSSVENLITDQKQLAKASEMGMAPPVFGSFTATLNGERHWRFSCMAESARYGRNVCADIPVGAHWARWIHNREVLQVFAYAADRSSISVRYLDVEIDAKNPPPPDDPVENLPAFQPTIPQAKTSYPELIHVYDAVSLSFQVGELPAQTNCNITAFTSTMANVNCTSFPPVPISRGRVDVHASVNGKLKSLSCEARWKWSKCSVVAPGFYLARWKDASQSEIILVSTRNGKPEEMGFAVGD